MALSANSLFESMSAGSDTSCSGGFNPANANFATDGAATSANTSAPVFSSASYSFGAGDVGAKLFLKLGTNSVPGWYPIASVAGGNATLTATVGSAPLYNGARLTNNAAVLTNVSAGCATVASPTGLTWGIDYSQQAAAQFSFTDLVSVTTTTITSVAFPFGVNCVGNLMKVTTGTGWTVQTVEIVSVASITATTDRSVGGAGLSGGTGFLGGAFAGPQLFYALALTGSRCWVKNDGAYTMSTATPNIANGRLNAFANSAIEGYEVVRGDMGARPVFTLTTATSMLAMNGQCRVTNIVLDCDSVASSDGATGTSLDFLYYVIVRNATDTAFATCHTFSCVADNCLTGFTATVTRTKDIALNCTTGFSGIAYMDECYAIGCTTGFTAGGAGYVIKNTVAYDCVDGFNLTTQGAGTLERCIAVKNSGIGFDFTSGGGTMIECAYFDNTGGDVVYNVSSSFQPAENRDGIDLSADPFVNAAANNFTLNNTLGGGALLRNLAFTYPSDISTISYSDVGPAQHQDVSTSSFSYASS